MVLQVQCKSAQQQLRHVTTSFAVICAKFQDRYQSEGSQQMSADTLLASSKLELSLQEAQHSFGQQQQRLQEAVSTLDGRKQNIHALKTAMAGMSPGRSTQTKKAVCCRAFLADQLCALQNKSACVITRTRGWGRLKQCKHN